MAVCGNHGGEVPVVDDVLSSHEQEIYPTSSYDENGIEFKVQTDRNVDLRSSFLPLKLKFVKGRGYDTYESKEKISTKMSLLFSLKQAMTKKNKNK